MTPNEKRPQQDCGGMLDVYKRQIKHLLAKIKSLPDNLTEFGKKILMDIASGTQSLNPFPNCRCV